MASAEARLGLLRTAYDVAFADRRAKLTPQIAATRQAIATARQADWPLEALTILVEHTGGSQDRPAVLSGQLKAGNLPDDFHRRYDAAHGEAQQRALVQAWYREQFDADPGLKAARERYATLGDVVPAALAAGSVKLRRARGAVAGARTALLEDAERLFLAIPQRGRGPALVPDRAGRGLRAARQDRRVGDRAWQDARK